MRSKHTARACAVSIVKATMAMVPFFLGLVFLLTPLVKQAKAQSCDRITAEDLGNTTSPSSDGLIASILALQSGELYVDVQLLQYNLVCEATAGTRDQYRSISVVAEYLVNGSEVSIQSQFEFSCQIEMDQDEWGIGVSGSTGETVTTPPSATLNTTLRRDCYQCLSPARPGSTANNSAHCLACSQNCTGLLMCTSQFIFSCCNVMNPMGGCLQSCPSTANGTADFNCECLPGYTGGDCGTNIDDCSSNPCRNNGSCVDDVNDFICECGVGYTGMTCSVSMEQCDITCENGGTCVRNSDRFSCQCLSGYTGNLCQDASTGTSELCGRVCIIGIIGGVVGFIILFALVTNTITCTVMYAKIRRQRKNAKKKRQQKKEALIPQLTIANVETPPSTSQQPTLSHAHGIGASEASTSELPTLSHESDGITRSDDATSSNYSIARNTISDATVHSTSAKKNAVVSLETFARILNTNWNRGRKNKHRKKSKGLT